MRLPSLDGNESNNSGNKSNSSLPNMEELELPTFDDLEEVEGEEVLDEEDDIFEEVEIEDVMEDEDLYNEEIYKAISEMLDEEEAELPRMKDEEEIRLTDDYNPDYEEDVSKAEERKFIDKENEKLIPFGGERSKKSIKTSDFDKRKNLLAKTKIVRFIVMLILLVLFIVGLKNTFFPSHVYSDDQIRAFAREGAGQTLFPRERGEAFVESFMESFLTFDRSRPEYGDILSYYYGEDSFSKVGYEKTNMVIGADAKQHIIIGPTVYDVKLLTDYSALFKVNAYVSNTDGSEVDGNSSAGRWLAFSVNVYYDEKGDSLAITPDSPSLIPSYRIGKQESVPERAPFGNGKINTEIGPEINPTINGFVQAYADSSIASHEAILQYISDKDDINLYDGFGGTVELNGSPDTAISRTIYNGDDGIYRVDLKINWIDKVASGDGHKVEYTSRYIMRINPEGNGKYTVSSFVPYTYYTR
mgnify:CR=1 FL=1